jgi:hypothetical protein
MATTNYSHRGIDAEIDRTATSFRRERRVKIIGVLGALALGLGALLMFTGGSFYRSYSPAAEATPAYEAPVDDQATTTTTTTTSDDTTGALGATPNTPQEATPAVSDRFKDMQEVDPVFDETHRPDLTSEDSDTPSETPDKPSNTPE